MTTFQATAPRSPRLLGGAFGRAALLALAAGLLLLGQWSDPTEGTAFSRSLTLAALPLVLPVLRWAVLPRPGLGGYVALVGGVVAGPSYSLFYDPLRDGDCLQCLPGAFAVLPDIATADTLRAVGNAAVVTGLFIATLVRPPAPAPAALAAAGLLPLFGHPVPAALAGIVIVTLAWVAPLASIWWSDRQLGRLVAGLQEAADPDRIEELERRSDLSPALQLGLVQARLRLGLAEQSVQIDESRRRIVERADQEARRLERDLHDGAQQYLLGLGLALLAEPQTASTALALRETNACLEDLRTVAREVYPPVLESSGLRPALVALASGRLTALDIPDQRFSPAVERTAYLVVADIFHRGSDRISVDLSLVGAELVLVVDGPPPPREAHIHDRVAAAGGTLQVEEERTVMRLPCG